MNGKDPPDPPQDDFCAVWTSAADGQVFERGCATSEDDDDLSVGDSTSKFDTVDYTPFARAAYDLTDLGYVWYRNDLFSHEATCSS